MSNKPCEFFQSSPWMDDAGTPCSMRNTEAMAPKAQTLPRDGPAIQDPDEYWMYRQDLLMEADSSLHAFLGLLVDFHQVKMMSQLLLLADVLEFTIYREPQRIPGFRFRFDFSSGISLEYASKHFGCMVWVDGKQDTLNKLSSAAMADLRDLMAEVFEQIKMLPIWDVVSSDDRQLTVRRKPLV